MGREGTKAAIADIERIKIRDNQPLRQGKQTKLLLKERRKRTGKQVKEQRSMILTLGEKVKMKKRKFRTMNPRKSHQDGPHFSRTARLNYGQPAYRDLNEQLSRKEKASPLGVKLSEPT